MTWIFRYKKAADDTQSATPIMGFGGTPVVRVFLQRLCRNAGIDEKTRPKGWGANWIQRHAGGRGRRTRTLKDGFGDRYVTITSYPYIHFYLCLKNATHIV